MIRFAAITCLPLNPLSASSERRLQPVEILRAEHHPVVCCDVDEIEIDSGLGNDAGEVGQRSGTVFDVDHHHLALGVMTA